MEIFKFGGASVKDAEGVRNFMSMLQRLDKKEVLIVISAMGKMTNAFEDLVKAYHQKENNTDQYLEEARLFHLDIIENLGFDENASVYKEIEAVFEEIAIFFKKNNSTDYDYVYDQIVSKAEFISTRICSAYLSEHGLKHQWLDVRKCIKTDSDFRRAKVDWDLTTKAIHEMVDTSGITITQGFIGSDNFGRTTTLGKRRFRLYCGYFCFLFRCRKSIYF